MSLQSFTYRMLVANEGWILAAVQKESVTIVLINSLSNSLLSSPSPKSKTLRQQYSSFGCLVRSKILRWMDELLHLWSSQKNWNSWVIRCVRLCKTSFGEKLSMSLCPLEKEAKGGPMVEATLSPIPCVHCFLFGSI